MTKEGHDMTVSKGYLWGQTPCVNGHRYQPGDMPASAWPGGLCPRCHPAEDTEMEGTS